MIADAVLYGILGVAVLVVFSSHLFKSVFAGILLSSPLFYVCCKRIIEYRKTAYKEKMEFVFDRCYELYNGVIKIIGETRKKVSCNEVVYISRETRLIRIDAKKRADIGFVVMICCAFAGAFIGGLSTKNYFLSNHYGSYGSMIGLLVGFIIGMLIIAGTKKENREVVVLKTENREYIIEAKDPDDINYILVELNAYCENAKIMAIEQS